MAGKKLDGTIGKGVATNIIDDKKKEFLDVYMNKGGNITRACLELSMSRAQFYVWYHADPHFKAMMDDPAVKKECRRIQASFYAEVLQTHTTDSPTSAMFFFNKAESIMKLLHMSPTKMDFKMRTIKTFEDINLAADEIQNAMYEGLLEKIEFEQLKEILELKRKTYETRDVIEEIEALTEKYKNIESNVQQHLNSNKLLNHIREEKDE